MPTSKVRRPGHTDAEIAARLKEAAGKVTSLAKVGRLSFVTSGVSWFDLVFGGLPCGAALELYGEDGVGKTMAAWKIVAERLAAGEWALWFGSEGIDPDLAALCGVDVNHEHLRIIDQELSDLEGLEICRDLASHMHLIVIDSVSAIITPSQSSKKHIGQTSASAGFAFNDFMHLVMDAIRRSGNTLLLLNQLRDKVLDDGTTDGVSNGGRRRLHDEYARVLMTLLPRSNKPDEHQLVRVEVRKRRRRGPQVVIFDLVTFEVVSVDGKPVDGKPVASVDAVTPAQGMPDQEYPVPAGAGAAVNGNHK